tara:strand:- start:2749 stop:3051 length:303 start_codon:yes stop_codon:yes gene_type:complete
MNGKTTDTSETISSVLEHHRGTLILVLGILSLVGCTFFTGIPAWIMGKGDLAKMKGDQMDSDGKVFTKAGMICGMISCILSIITIVGLGLLMALGTAMEW